jgi:acetyl-CoA C-acetyltransferase
VIAVGTPVLVGIGQYSERLGDSTYEGLSPVGIAARAAELALADAGIAAAEVDVLACTRQFDESFPGLPSALGSPDNFPRAVANRIESDPARCIYAVTGGQSPQALVTEFAGAIAAGEAKVALILAAEAASTVLAQSRAAERPDYTEITGVIDEDRGVGLKGMITREQAIHQLTSPPVQYAIFENARRSRLGLSRDAYTRDMGRWFAPFTEVAAANPHADVRTVSTPDELMTVMPGNRMIVDPYPKSVIAREKVNQSAAVLITSEEHAAELGIPSDQWVYLRGHSDLKDRDVTDRPDLSRSVPAEAAIAASLEMAGIGLDDVTALDLYSCFPIAVSAVAERVGLDADDPRRLTLTGGLPFFGGPGNGYSLHGIVEAVARCRTDADAWTLVGANGGMLSKYSVGVYSRRPGPWLAGDDRALQAELDAEPGVEVVDRPEGWGTIETWTVRFEDDPARAVVIGRLADGRRFIANDVPGDDELLAFLQSDDAPGARVYVRAAPDGNRVTLTPERMDELVPRNPGLRTGLRDDFTYVRHEAVDGVLEVTIVGLDERATLPAAAHSELAEIFDAFEADRALRVAILTSTGTQAFSADAVNLPGLLLMDRYPASGLAGLTSRTLTKPVIAAVGASALGSSFEIVLACHLVVAEDHVEFGLPQGRSGLLPAGGGLRRLAEKLPRSIANRLALTGRPIGAVEAERWGLVNRVVGQGESLKAARELAAEIVAVAPGAIRGALAVLDLADTDPAAADDLASDSNDALIVTCDAAEAFTAGLQGRDPHWRDN